MRIALILLLLFLNCSLQGQDFQLVGTVKDSETEIPITGLNIQIEGTRIRTASNLDGSYILKGIPAGKHTILLSHPEYKPTKVILEITSNMNYNFQLDGNGDVLRNVVIKTRRAADSEASARADERLTMRVLNVVSGREIELSPDITVANVAQRISGGIIGKKQQR
jgi:hypothetical protein